MRLSNVRMQGLVDTDKVDSPISLFKSMIVCMVTCGTKIASSAVTQATTILFWTLKSMVAKN